MRSLEELSIVECFDLIRHQVIGRVAVSTTFGPPLVVPVTFTVDGTSVVFRSDPGQKLAAVDRRLSFQVDGFDPIHRTGWSVLLQGRIETPDVAEVADLDLDPWVGPRTLWVRLVPELVTGRRLVLHQPDVDERGYR